MMKFKMIPKVIVSILILSILSITVVIGCVSPISIYTGKWEWIQDPQYPDDPNKKIKVCIEGGRKCVVVGEEMAIDIPDYLADLLE